MKPCAIVQNGNDIIKVSNLKRKYNKIINNPNMQILEECEASELEERFAYWNKPKEINQDRDTIKKYYFKNPKTGYTITSIYDNLDHLKTVYKDYMDYVRV